MKYASLSYGRLLKLSARMLTSNQRVAHLEVFVTNVNFFWQILPLLHPQRPCDKYISSDPWNLFLSSSVRAQRIFVLVFSKFS
jgi:hypothetical protein